MADALGVAFDDALDDPDLTAAVRAYADSPQVRARLALPFPHLIVGCRSLAQLVVEEESARVLALAAGVPRDGVMERLRRGAHPDWVSRDFAPGAKVQDARDLADVLDRYSGDAVHILVSGFDHLAPRSQEVFLKRLESSRAARSHLLVSDLAGVVLTIRSRCHILHVPPPDAAASLALLRARASVACDAAWSALRLARGDVDRALSWFGDPAARAVVAGWASGPAATLKVLVEAQRDVGPAGLDAAFVALKHNLGVAADKARALPLLRSLPKRYQPSLVLRQWLIDQFILVVAGAYGEVEAAP